jgi:hypothetical protein
VIKSFAIYLLTREDEIRARFPIITREGIIAAILWMITFFLLLLANAPREVITAYAIIPPSAIALYWYSIRTLIPAVMSARRRKFLRYGWKVLQILLITAIPLGALIFALFYNGDPAAALVAGNYRIPVGSHRFLFHGSYINTNCIMYLKSNLLQLALGDKNAHLGYAACTDQSAFSIQLPEHTLWYCFTGTC